MLHFDLLYMDGHEKEEIPYAGLHSLHILFYMQVKIIVGFLKNIDRHFVRWYIYKTV